MTKEEQEALDKLRKVIDEAMSNSHFTLATKQDIKDYVKRTQDEGPKRRE